MKRTRFYHSYAGHEHFAPLLNPTPDILRKWWYEFSQICGDYDVYLVGSLAEKMFGTYTGKVHDLDIVLTGEVKDLDELKRILRDAVYLGFKRDILCDIKYQSPFIKPVDEFQPFVIIKPGSTFVKMVGNVLTQRHLVNTEYTQLKNGLFQQHYTHRPKYDDKVQWRIKRGEYQGVVKKLKKNL